MEEHLTYYEILGLDENASFEKIKKAYRTIALNNHPDRLKNDPAATKRFMRATEAYNVLTDPILRKKYDRQFEPIQSVNDLFMRHESGKRVLDKRLPKPPNAVQSGHDVYVTIHVTEETLKQGNTIMIQHPHTKEHIMIELPHQPINWPLWCRIQRLGGKGQKNALAGDLYITLLKQGKKEEA